ncbi:succinate dehydrogenase, hydrophobic membrane anchor protein [Phenylobacterium sp.]|jgi:succinate dehydrogenase / fumarate reductase membrane anchor subunit|uniref:succinate dehydrogenase, hydrophobic membrane anchor protein n=1 Tax=Phenylobacterium sp. TaxID=1871053 RepID=UPI00086C0D75|nr:MAG: succinate dehydrogenase, hydrophobic membrane anchor protein [Phenylobacterium sp. SCN 69-14]
MSDFRTALSRARGLGAAKHGVGHWISERVSAAALIPLLLWGVFAALQLARLDHAGAVAWLQSSLVNPTLLVLLVVTSYLHMSAGLRVVIEDYIENNLNRAALLLLNLFACVLFGALAVFSILKVALGGAV